MRPTMPKAAAVSAAYVSLQRDRVIPWNEAAGGGISSCSSRSRRNRERERNRDKKLQGYGAERNEKKWCKSSG